jgi:hypothetical protein
MSRLLALGAAAPLAFSAIGGMSATVDPDDQAAADAAVAVFNERLTDAGWTSHGPLTQSAAPEEGDESAFGTCLGGFELYLDYTDRHFDGETARAFSDDFEFVADGAESVEATGDTGYAGAVVLTAAESAVGVLDTFVEQLGAQGTAACISQLQSFASMSDDESSVETTVTNDGDLGVGESSARLDFSVAMTFEGNELTSSATFAAARVDRSLVVVAIGGSGSAGLSLDPVAELASIVATFG